MAAIPWTAQAADRTAYAVRRSTQLLRPVYDRGTGSFALFGALSLCEDIEVPGVVRRTASLVDEDEDRRCGRVPCDERRWRMESQVVSVAAQALRAFFRYAETRGWCATGFAKGIQGPRIYKYEGVPEGPSWEQVRRLTRGLIGDAEFAVMKKNAVVINVGRGPTIDERAMIEALSQRRIRGAALDVFDQEPLPQGHPFYSLENVLLSPHCADRTPDWLDNAMRFFLEQLERFRRGETLLNVVDKALGY